MSAKRRKTMKATGFYEVVEKGSGWLHALDLTDGDRRVVIEDDTDTVTVFANRPVTPAEAAAIWTKHKMGSSCFTHEAGHVHQSPRQQHAPDISDDAMQIVWEGSGEELSHLTD